MSMSYGSAEDDYEGTDNSSHQDDDDDYKKLKTIRKIQAGEELTLKYSLYSMCNYL